MKSLTIVVFFVAVSALCSGSPLSIKPDNKEVIHKAGSHPGALIDHKEDPSCIGMMNWGRPATAAPPAAGGGAGGGADAGAGDAEAAPARMTMRRAGTGRSTTTNTNTRTRRRQQSGK